ncbi:MAG: glycoside hydrolase family 3 C-terminal domain-containing protein [Clostridia bacterium]|nr:glycoside hydrolase family 3 C-terminal domain-containing protein [Clostridia bacterium]
MTVEEKAAQTDMLSGVDFATKPSPIHNCSVEPDTEYNVEKLKEEFGTSGIGFVHDNYSTPEAMNRIQKYFIENSRLGIPVIFTGEALHGISGTRGTVFPSPIGLGATFDKEIVNKVGSAIGKETRSLGIYEILAPNLDVARDTRWGRTEETFGEDTYLSSRMAVAIVSGEQKGDISRKDAVIAEPKHYCVHGIPEGGTNCSPARAGRRETEGCYLPVFEAAIKEGGAYNVMVSYNCVDGDVLMVSEHYLKEILKERFALKGYSRADWHGVGKVKRDHKLVSTDRGAIKMALNNGLDMKGLDYPNKFWQETVTDLIKTGEIPMERIDDIVRRVLTVKFELGLFEDPYTDENAWESIIRCDEHRNIALDAARKSMTLLKNNGVLPLSEDIKSVAVIGPSSAAQKIGGYSSIPTGYEVPSVYEKIKELLGDGVTVRQHDGCAITPDKKTPRFVEGQPHLASEGEDEIPDDIEGAVKVASECDYIIFVGGDNSITSGEGRDRCEYILAGKQRELIKRLSELGKKLIVVLEVGKPVDLTVEEDICDAILVAWFGGEMGAQAITETLFGKYNPAGRLNVSFPRNAGSIPCYYSMLPGGDQNYYEGPKKARYPFGFGLSYTTFEYSDIKAEKKGRYDVDVTVTVKNTGKMAGDEVVQLYIDDVESSVVTPPLLLKGFERVHFEAGEEKQITFNLNENSFSLIDINYKKTVEPGDFRILVGSASDNIKLEISVYLN